MAVGARSGAPVVKIELDRELMAKLQRTLGLLSKEDAPRLRQAMTAIGDQLAGNVRSRAPGSMAGKVVTMPVVVAQGSTGRSSLRARGSVGHPGAKSYEFGRRFWYEGYKLSGRRGRKVGGKGRLVAHQPGQPDRPFVGIVRRDAAIAATKSYAEAQISAAISDIWAKGG